MCSSDLLVVISSGARDLQFLAEMQIPRFARNDNRYGVIRRIVKERNLVLPRAGTGAVRASAGATRSCRHRGRRIPLGRNGKHREFRLQLLALTFRATGFLFPVNKSFKLVLAFLADVLEDRHPGLRAEKFSFLFKIKMWVLRNHLSRTSHSCRGAFCAAATRRPSPAS